MARKKNSSAKCTTNNSKSTSQSTCHEKGSEDNTNHSKEQKEKNVSAFADEDDNRFTVAPTLTQRHTTQPHNKTQPHKKAHPQNTTHSHNEAPTHGAHPICVLILLAYWLSGLHWQRDHWQWVCYHMAFHLFVAIEQSLVIGGSFEQCHPFELYAQIAR